MNRSSFGVVIAAGGAGRRFGRLKQFLPLLGRPLLEYSLDAFAGCDQVGEVIVVCPSAHLEEGRELLASWRRAKRVASSFRSDAVAGGGRRQDSVLAGLSALSASSVYALVHDAARPLLQASDVERLADAVREHGAAVLGTPSVDSVKRVSGGVIVDELDRETVWTVQTPQGAETAALIEAYASEPERDWTDETSALRARGVVAALVEGPRENLKITSPGDERLAEMLLAARGEPERGPTR